MIPILEKYFNNNSVFEPKFINDDFLEKYIEKSSSFFIICVFPVTFLMLFCRYTYMYPSLFISAFYASIMWSIFCKFNVFKYMLSIWNIYIFINIVMYSTDFCYLQSKIILICISVLFLLIHTWFCLSVSKIKSKMAYEE